jgi:hypothetical protein
MRVTGARSLGNPESGAAHVLSSVGKPAVFPRSPPMRIIMSCVARENPFVLMMHARELLNEDCRNERS